MQIFCLQNTKKVKKTQIFFVYRTQKKFKKELFFVFFWFTEHKVKNANFWFTEHKEVKNTYLLLLYRIKLEL